MKTVSAKWLSSLMFVVLTATTAVAQTNRLNFSPGEIFRFGDTRDLDCTVQMKVTSSLLTNRNYVKDIRVLRAVDDQGKDLNKLVASYPKCSLFPLPAQPWR